MMTDSHLTRRAWLAPTLSLVVFWAALPSHAQSSRSSNEFYRHGDAFSEKVSGFFGRIFGSSKPPAQAPVYQQAPQGQGYARNQAGAPQQPYYQQAPAQGRQTAATAAPQRPVYRQAPASSPVTGTAKRSTVQSKGAVAQRQTVKPKTNKGVYTTTRRSKAEASDSGASSSRKNSPPESVVQAPQTPAYKEDTSKTYTVVSSSNANKNSTSDLYPLPQKETPSTSSTPPPSSTSKQTTSSTAGSSSAAQEFPKGTATSKPGRVVSPYEPHNELDVQGLPSGSLALDPTTQKVFKVP